jgi:GH24 family phage-related lysozyme (muramidase)
MIPELHPKTMDLLFQFEGKPRLDAQLCEGGRYEVAYGVTYHPDGRPIGPNDSITADQVMPYTLNALAKEAAPVWAALTRAVTPEQAGALAVMAYNVGGNAAAKSSVVRHLNEGRYEDAAASFSMWTGATSSGPSPREIKAGIAPVFPKWSRETGRWLSPEGKPTTYFRRFRGLLRRHHATGCLFMGLDWPEATKNDAVEMAVEPVWNAAKGRWEDKIIRQTEFPAIYAIARKYPLANVPINSAPDAPVAPAPTVPVEVTPLPEIDSPEVALPSPEIEFPLPAPPPVETPVPTPPKPQPTLPNDFDPNAGIKSMVFSRRFWGWLLVILGRFSFATDASASLLAQTGGAVGQVANGIAADPLLLDAYTGFAVMIVGEAVRWWGEKKATKALK